jgi:putative solute:sodium symporter small subunit
MAKELQSLDREKLKAYWRENVRLTSIILFIWFVVTYVCAFFVNELNQIVIFGFPFGYYMGAQGSLIVFVVLIFWYAFSMNKKDKEYGVEEEEE